jgi:hypothetical protein
MNVRMKKEEETAESYIGLMRRFVVCIPLHVLLLKRLLDGEQ